MKPPVLYIVVPCYNEQEVLPETSKRLRHLVRELTGQGKKMCIRDRAAGVRPV